MQDFQNLRVWQTAHAHTLAVYQATASFPTDERFGLTSQLRRATASVPANLAEGCGRQTDADFARFVQIASGPNSEALYHLRLAHDLAYLDAGTFESLDAQARAVRRQLIALLKRLRS